MTNPTTLQDRGILWMARVMVVGLIAGCGQAPSTNLPEGSPLYYSTLAEAKAANDLEDMDWLVLHLWPDGVPEDCDSCRAKFQTSRGVLGFEFRDHNAANRADKNGLASMQQSLAATATFGGILVWKLYFAGAIVITGSAIYVDPEAVEQASSDLAEAVSELVGTWGKVLSQVVDTAAGNAPDLIEAADLPSNVDDALSDYFPNLDLITDGAVNHAKTTGDCTELMAQGSIVAGAAVEGLPGFTPVLVCADANSIFVSNNFIRLHLDISPHTVFLINVGRELVIAGPAFFGNKALVEPGSVAIVELDPQRLHRHPDKFCVQTSYLDYTVCVPIMIDVPFGRPMLAPVGLVPVGVAGSTLGDDPPSTCEDDVMEITCDSGIITDNTSGGENHNPGYLCTPSTNYDGPEKVYMLRGMSGNLTVRLVRDPESDEPETGLPEGSGRLDLFVLDDGCKAYNADSESSCLVGGQTELYFSAIQDKVYYIIVDGYMGASGLFHLQIDCY